MIDLEVTTANILSDYFYHGIAVNPAAPEADARQKLMIALQAPGRPYARPSVGLPPFSDLVGTLPSRPFGAYRVKQIEVIEASAGMKGIPTGEPLIHAGLIPGFLCSMTTHDIPDPQKRQFILNLQAEAKAVLLAYEDNGVVVHPEASISEIVARL